MYEKKQGAIHELRDIEKAGKMKIKVLLISVFILLSGIVYAGDVRVRVFCKYEVDNLRISAANNGTHESAYLKLDNGAIKAGPGCKGSSSAGNRLFWPKNKDGYLLRYGSETRLIPGAVEVTLMPGEDGMVIITTMDTEDYVPCVLSSEMDAAIYKPELAKAFAVTIRTFAKNNNRRHKGYDFCDLTHCEVFKGVPPDKKMWYRASGDTKGLVLTGPCAKEAVYFSACCGGVTENAGEFAKGRADKCGLSKPDVFNGKNLCESHRYFSWVKRLNKSDVETALKSFTTDKDIKITSMKITAKSAAGRVKVIDFTYEAEGLQKHAAIDANKYFSAFGKIAGWALVPSKWFDVKKEGNGFILTGHGHGHGVGLCLQGGYTLAGMGKNYKEILAFYFPDLKIGWEF